MSARRLALLAFNTYPLWTALWDRLLYRRTPEPAVLKAMPVILDQRIAPIQVTGALLVVGTVIWLGTRKR